MAPNKVSWPYCQSPIHLETMTALATRLRCSPTAPLERPVVPPVYCSRAMSSPVTVTLGLGLRVPWAMKSFNVTSPGSITMRSPSFFSFNRP